MLVSKMCTTAQSIVLKIPCTIKDLCLDITLQCGQSFRWRKTASDKWIGMIGNSVWTLSQDEQHLHCVLHGYLQDKPADAAITSTAGKETARDQESLPDGMVETKEEALDKTQMSLDNKKRKTRSIDHKLCDDPKLNDNHHKVTKAKRNKKAKISSEIIPEMKTETNQNEDHQSLSMNYLSDSSNSPTYKFHDYYTQLVKKYFRLEVSLPNLYAEWSKKDANFGRIAPSFPGVRMLDQPPVENIFSFICSSNNNITRITRLVENLCVHFGDVVCEVDGGVWYTFPTVEQLCRPDTEQTLRTLGFGYRAAYISQTASKIAAVGEEAWLSSLKLLPYEGCRAALCQLAGVGPKVADCICLMSMGHLSTIPVDIHVFQIAARDYLPQLRSHKTVTAKVYTEISRHFRELYGDYAGWAHSVLFSADLRKFSSSGRESSSAAGQKKKTKKNKPTPKTKS